MDAELQKIGARVREARLKKNMTQLQLSEAVGISLSFLGNIENGRQSMNLRTLIALSQALDVSADALIKDTPTPSRLAEQIEQELTSCTPKEREAILQMILTMKNSLSSLKGKE